MSHFFTMGGYGVYVWSAFGVVFIGLIGNVVWINFKNRKILRQLRKY